jgi:hypothetical protein
MSSYRTADTTRAKAPATEPCHGCSAATGNPLQRYLCDGCFTNGLIRSQFTTSGQRIETPPLVTPRAYGDDNRPAVVPPRKNELNAEGLATLHERVNDEARRRFDDDLLLDAVDELSGAGKYRTPDGEAAAGLLAAARRGGLTLGRADAAAGRLIEAGRLRRVVALVYRDGGRRCGKAAAGLQIVASEAAAPTS